MRPYLPRRSRQKGQGQCISRVLKLFLDSCLASLGNSAMLKPDDHVLEYLDDYLHDVLTEIEDAHLERHLEGCRICKVALEEAEKRRTAIEALPAHEASEQLIQ